MSDTTDTTTEELVDEFYNYLRRTTDIKKVNEGWTEITLPFLDKHIDHIQLYVRYSGHEDSMIEINDNGATLESMRTDLRDMTEVLNILKTYGVLRNNKTNELYIISNMGNFRFDMQRMIAATTVISYLA